MSFARIALKKAIVFGNVRSRLKRRTILCVRPAATSPTSPSTVPSRHNSSSRSRSSEKLWLMKRRRRNSISFVFWLKWRVKTPKTFWIWWRVSLRTSQCCLWSSAWHLLPKPNREVIWPWLTEAMAAVSPKGLETAIKWAVWTWTRPATFKCPSFWAQISRIIKNRRLSCREVRTWSDSSPETCTSTTRLRSITSTLRCLNTLKGIKCCRKIKFKRAIFFLITISNLKRSMH